MRARQSNSLTCKDDLASRCDAPRAPGWGAVARTLMLVALAAPAWADDEHRQTLRARDHRVSLRVLGEPRTVPTRSGTRLTYELVLGNESNEAIQPESVDVFDGDTHRLLARYRGADLQERLGGPDGQTVADGRMEQGQQAMLYLDLVTEDVPAELTHRILYRDTSGSGQTQVVEGSASVRAKGVPALHPPLVSGPWVAIYDSRWPRGHRRAGYVRGGAFRIPGRFAIDWVRLDGQGRKTPYGSDTVARAYSYGQPVFAVADGTVVSVRSMAPERHNLSDPAPSREGNEITIKLEDGSFAHYGHLRPGSARVAVGDVVRAREPIAEVGFSGSASDPQLHFALTDGPVELASEGVPYVLSHYRLLGNYSSAIDAGAKPWNAHGEPTELQGYMPSAGDVVSFDPPAGL